MAVRVTVVLQTNHKNNSLTTIYVTIYENNDLITRMAVNEQADLKQD